MMRDKSSSIKRFSRFVVDNEWLILLLLLPAALFPTPLRFAVMLIIPLLWLLRKIGFGHFVISTPLDLAILVMLLMVLVSLYATFDIIFSLPKISGIVYGVGVYYATVAATSRGKNRLAAGIGVLLACGLAVAFLSLIGTRWVTKFPLLASLTEVLPRVILFSAAPEGFSPNQIAGVLLWVFPISIMAVVISIKEPGFWYKQLTRWRGLVALVIGLIVALVVGGTFLLTQSRSGYMGMAFVLLLISLGIWGLYKHKIFGLLLLISALIVGGALFIFISGLGSETTPIVDEITVLGDTELPTDNLQSRVEIWSRAIYGIEDFPFTGMGIGTFRRVVPVLYPLFLTSPDQDIAHAHNMLLQVALDLGIPGLIAYLAIWLGTVSMLWQTWCFGSKKPIRLLALGFTAALIGYFIYGLTETIALGAKPGFIFWLLLGLITGMYLLERTPTEAAFS